MIFYYCKGVSPIWNTQYLPYDDDYIKSSFTEVDQNGRRFRINEVTGSGLRNGDSGKPWRGHNPSSKGRHWAVPKQLQEKLSLNGSVLNMLDQLDEQEYIEWGKGDSNWPRLRYYLEDMNGVPLQDIWTDIYRNTETDYPTEKPIKLAERIIKSSTGAGDIILDCFQGSGTTLAAAQKLGRRWIGCDINKGAIQTTAKRLHSIMQEQAEAIVEDNEDPQQSSFAEVDSRFRGNDENGDNDSQPNPAQLNFTTWRVNDYDLQIQHNEAVQLACEHIGVTRSRADGYFDGTLGKKLVKIVPFNHPLTPLDLEDLKNELKSRPEEERHVVVVCLGLELNARAWVEDYNRNKPINRFEVIELRTDRKYGGFIKHEPLTVSVSVKKLKDKLKVTVNDVYSPGIVQRLNMEEGLFKAQIDDWRAVVDCIMIDTDYDGETFNVALSDIPSRKQDLVEGSYELPLPENPSANIAVKIIDMLGEEVIVCKS